VLVTAIFSVMMGIFFQEGDFSQLMTKLKEIFNYPSQYSLLLGKSVYSCSNSDGLMHTGFKRYVRREHKDTFEEQCSLLTSSTGTIYQMVFVI